MKKQILLVSLLLLIALSFGKSKNWDLALSSPAIQKDELTVLLVEELELEKVTPKVKEKIIVPDDIKYKNLEKKFWAEKEIAIAVNKGFIQVSADKKFYPSKLIEKIDFAEILAYVYYIKSGDNSVFLKSLEHKSSIFSDVRTDNYAYSALAFCAENHIINKNTNGQIEPHKNISGKEALQMIQVFNKK